MSPGLLDPYPDHIRNLVFEGGGVWGIAYEGALLELERLGVLQRVRRVGGASAGAITAALLAVGYTPSELGAVLRNTNFQSFEDDSLGFGRDTARLLSEYGWYKGERFGKWMRERIQEKVRAVSESAAVTPPPNHPRFRDLAEWRGRLQKKGVFLPEPYVIGSNLSQQRREVYSHEQGHSPELRLWEAVRRSMSIPLFFACARGEKRDVIVDGGLTWNYPVNLFDDVRYLKERPELGLKTSYGTGKGHRYNPCTLGFRVDSTKELQLNLLDWRNEPVKIDNILQYAWSLVGFVRAIANKLHLHKNDWARTVFIDVGETIGFTHFAISEAEKDFLSARGAEGVAAFHRWRASPEGRAEFAKILESIRADG